MEFKVKTKVRIRFFDLDAMGHANNAVFFTYMEQARLAYFKQVPQLDFRIGAPAKGISLILASIRCDFLSPAFLDEELEVAVAITRLGRSSFDMEYRIKEMTTGREVAKRVSTQVYFDYPNKKSVELPELIVKRFEEIEGRKL